MVKLPIKLETRSEWKEVLGEAVKTQRTLEAVAIEEEKQTGRVYPADRAATGAAEEPDEGNA